MRSVESKVVELLHHRGFLHAMNAEFKGDYVRAGVVDSLGLLGWVLELEDQFDVELTDDDVASAEFRTVEGLTNLIERKMR